MSHFVEMAFLGLSGSHKIGVPGVVHEPIVAGEIRVSGGVRAIVTAHAFGREDVLRDRAEARSKRKRALLARAG